MKPWRITREARLCAICASLSKQIATLIDAPVRCIWGDMTSKLTLSIDLQDRARLRERFFGATRTVLAHL